MTTADPAACPRMTPAEVAEWQRRLRELAEERKQARGR
jgi:hypothetical protein